MHWNTLHLILSYSSPLSLVKPSECSVQGPLKYPEAFKVSPTASLVKWAQIVAGEYFEALWGEEAWQWQDQQWGKYTCILPGISGDTCFRGVTVVISSQCQLLKIKYTVIIDHTERSEINTCASVSMQEAVILKTNFVSTFRWVKAMGETKYFVASYNTTWEAEHLA